jgi:hypothetical protein
MVLALHLLLFMVVAFSGQPAVLNKFRFQQRGLRYPGKSSLLLIANLQIAK